MVISPAALRIERISCRKPESIFTSPERSGDQHISRSAAVKEGELRALIQIKQTRRADKSAWNKDAIGGSSACDTDPGVNPGTVPTRNMHVAWRIRRVLASSSRPM